MAILLTAIAVGCGGTPDAPGEIAPPPMDAPAEIEPASEYTPCDEDLDTVMAALSQRWADVNSFTAEVALTADMPMGPMTVTSEGTGVVEALRSGSRWKMRMEMTNTMDAGVPGLGGMEAEMLTVSDGEANYIEMAIMGQRKAAKKPVREGTATALTAETDILKSLREQGDVTLLGETAINGFEAYAVQTVFNEERRQETPGGPVRAVTCFAKDSGLRVRVQAFDEDDAILTELTYKKATLNPDIDPERFVYTPPEGVEVETVENPGEALANPAM
ncbi:MAG: outer membrane lipoprotein carrier protein LolA [bacterium]|nr:outer membrane lipoprotein carrier protein LolA [bacterium]